MKRLLIFCQLCCLVLLMSCQRVKALVNPVTSIEFLENNRFDFGEYDGQDSVVHYYRYKNVGNVPFVINQIKTQCGCTRYSYSKQPLPPGGVDSIRVALGTKNLIRGFVIKRVEIYSNCDSVYFVDLQGILK